MMNEMNEIVEVIQVVGKSIVDAIEHLKQGQESVRERDKREPSDQKEDQKSNSLTEHDIQGNNRPLKSDFICWYCNKPGHLRRTCRFLKRDSMVEGSYREWNTGTSMTFSTHQSNDPAKLDGRGSQEARKLHFSSHKNCQKWSKKRNQGTRIA